MGSVLLVEMDGATRDRLAGWIEDEGLDALQCPGPSAPEYTCLGARGEPCPLASACDVVVLDMRLAPEEVMTGVPSWELLVYYVVQGKKVIVLSEPDDAVHPLRDDQVQIVARPPQRDDLLRALRRFLPEEAVLDGRNIAR